MTNSAIGFAKSTALGISIFFAVGAYASDYECSVTHWKENPKANAGALVCGKFRFDTESESRQQQQFKPCQGIQMEYFSQVSSGGTERIVEISSHPKEKASTAGARLISKSLPNEFRLQYVLSNLRGKFSQHEDFTVECHKQ